MRTTNPLERALMRLTPMNAIRAKCAECTGCTSTHTEVGFREAISACTSKSCPLYPLRPYRGGKTAVGPKSGVSEQAGRV